MKTFRYGSQPTYWTAGPVEITYNPDFRKADGSPVLSQATGVYAMGANDEVRWLTDGSAFQMEMRSPVYSRDDIIRNDDGLNLGSLREKLADHGYAPLEDGEVTAETPGAEPGGEPATGSIGGDDPGLGGA